MDRHEVQAMDIARDDLSGLDIFSVCWLLTCGRSTGECEVNKSKKAQCWAPAFNKSSTSQAACLPSTRVVVALAVTLLFLPLPGLPEGRGKGGRGRAREGEEKKGDFFKFFL